MSDSIDMNGREAPAGFDWRWLLGQIHLWLGLILCLPLIVLGVTGSVLVYNDELERLLGPDRPAPAMAEGARHTLTDVVAAARTGAPNDMAPLFVSVPEEEGGPVVVRFGRAGQRGPGGGAIVRVDPVSLEASLQEPGGSGGLMRTLHSLHGSLMISEYGRSIVGWLGVVMVTLGCSGLVLWWPRPGRWRSAFVVKRGAHGVRLHRDLHGAVGIWFLIVFIIVSATGVYISFPEALGNAVRSILPARDMRGFAADIKVKPQDGATPLDIDAVVALAAVATGDGEMRFVGLPARRDQPYRVTLARPGDAAGAPAITAYVDPWAGRVVEMRDPRGYTAGETLMAWQRPLHEGGGLGGLWRFLVFLSGLLPLLFAITGISMWWLKRRARRLVSQRARHRVAAE